MSFEENLTSGQETETDPKVEQEKLLREKDLFKKDAERVLGD